MRRCACGVNVEGEFELCDGVAGRVESVSMVSEVPWCWAVVVEKVEKDVEDASSGTVGSSS